MKIFNLARLLSLPLALGACVASATTTTNVYFPKVGVPEIFRYAAADRDFLTEIHGNPSTASKAAFDASVIAVMPRAAHGLVTNFTTNPSADARDGYRLVMVFSGDSRYNAGAACQGADDAALMPAAGRVEIQAAFCYREDVLSEVHVAYTQGAPALKDAVTQVVLNLFPRVDPTIDRGSNNDELM